jgi:hypothetical protein
MAAALGAGRRRQSEDTLDPEWHLRLDFGNHNFAVCSRVAGQFDSPSAVNIETMKGHRFPPFSKARND